MKWFWKSKQPVPDTDEPVEDAEWRELVTRVKNIELILQRIDRRAYKRNGHEPADNEDETPVDEFSWMKRGK